MSDEIERRLAAAAQALREHEMISQRCRDLSARQDALSAEFAKLLDRYAGEQQDVERLEGMSLARVLASLAGSRDERLARERAESEAARYLAAEARARLDAIRQEQAAAADRRDQLAGAPRAYVAALGEMERQLTASGDPRGRPLLRLATERGRLAGELREADEAAGAAAAALAALAQVEDRLGSASGWSTYDTWFGGGAIASAVKHDRMDEAARAAAEADRRLAVLRTELADVPDPGLTAPQLAVGGGIRFADVWFDNIFTDFAVADRIRQARRQVAESVEAVERLREGLMARARQAQARLAAIETERRNLLTSAS